MRSDLLVLGEGDSVGAAARLHQAASLRVQKASLTGESEAVLKDASTLREPAALSDRLNMVFKGTSVAQGTGRAVVTAIGMDSQIGAIWRGTALPLLLDLARKPNFLHDSSVANLDDLLNPSRGSTAPHPFYFNSSAQRSDMIEFLRGLSTP